MTGRTIAISSGKGGTGKTFLSANLGISLAQLGKKVIMVDADVDMANLELVLGMEGRPITLQDIVSGEAHIQDAIYDVPNSTAKFVPAGLSPSQFRRVDSEKLQAVVQQLAEFADFVLMDSPAGVGKDTIACLSSCKETILVVTPEPMSATDAFKAKIVAEKMGSDVIGIVVNMIKGVRNELKDKDLTALLEAPILAKIQDDPQVREAVISGKPVVKLFPSSPASIAVVGLAARLAGVAAPAPVAQKKGLLASILGLFGRN